MNVFLCAFFPFWWSWLRTCHTVFCDFKFRAWCKLDRILMSILLRFSSKVALSSPYWQLLQNFSSRASDPCVACGLMHRLYPTYLFLLWVLLFWSSLAHFSDKLYLISVRRYLICLNCFTKRILPWRQLLDILGDLKLQQYLQIQLDVSYLVLQLCFLFVAQHWPSGRAIKPYFSTNDRLIWDIDHRLHLLVCVRVWNLAGSCLRELLYLLLVCLRCSLSFALKAIQPLAMVLSMGTLCF